VRIVAETGSHSNDAKKAAVARKSRLCSVVASCFALSAFTVAILAGLLGGNGASSVLGRAAVAMFVCYPVGLLVGLMCEKVVENRLDAMAQASRTSLASPGAAEKGSDPLK
jgi:uncharacterized protein involved in response to NO